MLGFTLSKLNLLILVTAIFAIISFFMFSLTDITVSRSAQQMVDGYVETVAGITDTDTLCFKHTLTIPENIKYFGGLEQSKRFYYVMEITRVPETYEEGEFSKVIFKIASRKKPDKFIATDSIDLNAQIFLYQWPVGDDATNLKETDTITLDPMRAVATSNSLVMVKEVFKGKKFLHLIACSSAAEQCKVNTGYAGCCVKGWRKDKESTCLPVPKDRGGASLCGTYSLTC